ncbi:MAG: zf-HC2 domain-containing protein [Anaerolineae bacterium]
MMEHTHRWAKLRLQAYYDGELDRRTADRVAVHVADCAACREELAALASLSSLLQEAPPAPALVPENQFVANVGLRLAHRPVPTLPERVLHAGWRWTPALLVGLWALFQAVSWMTTGILTLSALGVGAPLLEALSEIATGALQTAEPRWSDTLLAVFRFNVLWSAVETLGLGSISLWLMQLAFYLFLGLAIWSWLASWWARERHRQVEGMA